MKLSLRLKKAEAAAPRTVAQKVVAVAARFIRKLAEKSEKEGTKEKVKKDESLDMVSL